MTSHSSISSSKKSALCFGIGLVGMVFGMVFYRSLMVAIFCSLLFSYILGPLVNGVEARITKERLSAVLLVLLIVYGILLVAIASVMPLVYREGLGLIKLVPSAFGELMLRVEPLKQMLLDRGLLGRETLDQFFTDIGVFQQISDQVTNAINQLWKSTPLVVGGVINVLLIPLLTFMLLSESRNIFGGIRSILPVDTRSFFRDYWHRFDKTLKSVLKGQVMVAASLAILYMVGLGLVGLKFGLGIGAIAGMCRLIPYVDVVVGLSLSLLVIVSQGAGLSLTMLVVAVFIVVQLIDGMVITPRIIGERAGLHPGLVIVTILALADWLGLFGVIIAVPCLAIAKVSLEVFLPHYRLSSFFDS